MRKTSVPFVISVALALPAAAGDGSGLFQANCSGDVACFRAHLRRPEIAARHPRGPHR
jgi:hypothetical protein